MPMEGVRDQDAVTRAAMGHGQRLHGEHPSHAGAIHRRFH